MKKDCCVGDMNYKAAFLVFLAALFWFNDMYGWFNLMQMIALVLALAGLKILYIANYKK